MKNQNNPQTPANQTTPNPTELKMSAAAVISYIVNFRISMYLQTIGDLDASAKVDSVRWFEVISCPGFDLEAAQAAQELMDHGRQMWHERLAAYPQVLQQSLQSDASCGMVQ